MFESPGSERRLLTELLERESKNTVRMLRAFPPAQLDLRCGDCAQSARELAWSFVQRERLIHYLLIGRTAGTDAPPPHSPFEILAAYEAARRTTREALARISSQRWTETLRAPVAPDRWDTASRGELLWLTWKELTRHGAHFAIHLRVARERVAREDIGPTAPAPEPLVVPA